MNDKIQLLEQKLVKKKQSSIDNLTQDMEPTQSVIENNESNNEILEKTKKYSKLNFASPEPYNGNRNKSKIDSWVWQLNQ